MDNGDPEELDDLFSFLVESIIGGPPQEILHAYRKKYIEDTVD
jgi:hypothetical protein